MPFAKLPVVISIPHGGTAIPKELVPKCKLDFKTILLDGDTWSRELYNLRDYAVAYVDTSLARVVLDMNRDPNDRPPKNPDGVVKTVTVDKQQVWFDENGLPENIVEELIKNYHRPYHQAIDEASKHSGAILGIDCHTMLPNAPDLNRDRGEQRPLICISNRGDFNGNSIKEPITAPTEILLALQDALKIVFMDHDIEFDISSLVSINNPFSGGYIAWQHGINGPLPWIQLEINRSIYMSTKDGYVDEHPNSQTSKNLNDVRSKIIKALRRIF